MENEWQLACPICKNCLSISDGEAHCLQNGHRFQRIDGIWRLLRPEREAYFAQFIREYETVRHAEGRSSADPAYYRALPFQDLSGKMSNDWAIRAQSFTKLLAINSSCIIPHSSLKILDLGAGNGWLSYQLARRGHEMAAVDLMTNKFDGLGAHVMYDVPFLPVQAEFEHLPFTDGQADMVIFNASLHYATDFAAVLREAWRVLKVRGTAVIIDTPIYHNQASGTQMIAEREAHFQQTYGFPSNAIASENYLTYQRLDELGQQLGIHWQLHWPIPRWRWMIRRLRASLRRQREPAQFPLILGKRYNTKT